MLPVTINPVPMKSVKTYNCMHLSERCICCVVMCSIAGASNVSTDRWQMYCNTFVACLMLEQYIVQWALKVHITWPGRSLIQSNAKECCATFDRQSPRLSVICVENKGGLGVSSTIFGSSLSAILPLRGLP